MARITLITILLSAALTAHAQPMGYLYWCDVDTSDVWRAKLDGSQVERVAEVFQPRGPVTADTANDTLYFGVQRGDAGSNELWISDLDGRNQQRLLETSGDVLVTDIEVDVASGHIYWNEGALVRRANLDGSGAETLFESTGSVLSVALDLSAQPAARLYFVDNYTGDVFGDHVIRSMLLDGADLQTLPDFSETLSKIAVDEANDRLFFSTIFGPIWRVNQDGNGLVSIGVNAQKAKLKVVGDRLYFATLSVGDLESVDLDGNDRRTEVDLVRGFRFFSIDTDSSTVYVNVDQIQKTNLDGSGLTPLIGRLFTTVHDVAVAADGTLYTQSSSELTTVDGATGDVLPVRAERTGDGDSRGIALDPVAATIYWVSSSGGTVTQVGTDGSGLLQLAGEVKPHDVVVDPGAGAVYWTAGIGSSGDLTGTIRTAALDLSSPADLITGLPNQIRGLDVDEGTGQLYFTDHGSGQIRRVDANGAGLVDVVAATMPHDVAVDETGGFIYWTEGIADSSALNASIRRAPLDGSRSAEDVVTGLTSYVRDLTVVYIEDEVFSDGFEAGTTDAWNSVVPVAR